MKTYTFIIGGKHYEVEVKDVAARDMILVVNGRDYTVSRQSGPASEPTTAPPPSLVPAGPIARPPQVIEAPIGPGATEEVRAPLPGKVLAVAVAPGDHIQYGDALCTLEAMKMESIIRAPIDGVVAQVHVAALASVQYNDLLVTIKMVSE